MKVLKGLGELALLLALLGGWAAVAIACTPTLWTGGDLAFNLQQLNEEAQGAPVLHLYSTRDAYTGYGQFVTGFRFVCYRGVQSAPSGCDIPKMSPTPGMRPGRRPSPATPGPGPGPCYITVIDWGQQPFGADLTQAGCEAQESNLGLVVE